MCGIAGIYGRTDEDLVGKMLNRQKYRGPDGRNFYSSTEFTVGHDRLAIIDVAGGEQPLSNEDESLWAAVNGEIYNYQELRASIEDKHEFQTNSDSEVVLHLFEEYGSRFVEKLDGMFAIAIWGLSSGLYLARDPLGIKPLYYGKDPEGNLAFSSEIKAITHLTKHLSEFPNGSYWKVDSDKTPVRYYDVPKPKHNHYHDKSVIEDLDFHLKKAVRKRLMSDVPLGTFLSGGLDSSLIAALVKEIRPGPLHSFSVGLEGSEDLLNARKVAKYIGTIHHERKLKPEEIIQNIPIVIGILESYDPALVRSAIPTFFVSELASRYVKVVLSGEGADELFAGYHYLHTMKGDFDQLSKELHDITKNLHNSNLQRVDRMTMAFGLEGRVPFLDTELIDFAFSLHPRLKYFKDGKWILRKVAMKYLPRSIVWRKKEKFSIGTGIGPLLEQHANDQISDDEFQSIGSSQISKPINKEELLYWNFFKGFYGRADVLATMGRARSLNPGQILSL